MPLVSFHHLHDEYIYNPRFVDEPAPNSYPGPQEDSTKNGCRPEPPQENIGARRHQMAQ